MPRFNTILRGVRSVLGVLAVRSVLAVLSVMDLKNMRGVISAIFAAVAPLIIVGCYDDFGEASEFEGVDVTTNITTEELSRLVLSDGYVDVNQDVRVRGYVTAHDGGGNFYKRFMIESGGYGIEIMEGLSEAFVRHQLGAEIVIQLNGLRLTRSRGVVQVGVAAAAGSYFDVDYMGHEYIVNQHITNTGHIKDIKPREFTLAELAADPELATSLCGSLIRVTGLRYYSTDDDDDGIWSGDRCFISATDPLIGGKPEATIWCYTSNYAVFSGDAIPNGMGSIVGILQGNNMTGGASWEMIIKPRDNDDLSF